METIERETIKQLLATHRKVVTVRIHIVFQWNFYLFQCHCDLVLFVSSSVHLWSQLKEAGH